ncbi:MAG: helix-turn-helix transcriptional regulator [Myxococcales bacterium]|nr:helix-turn-helix transcriptional regulator [Myxococcales bacterium]
MTQEALAEEANIDVRFLQRVERGTVNLRFHSFIRLAVALGIKPSALLRERKTIAPKAGRPKQIRRRTAE